MLLGDVVADGLAFPESPRWHGGELWIAEKRGGRVLAIAADGTVREVLRLDGQPGGLGWTPDGDLLVVGASQRALLRQRDGVVEVVADLDGVVPDGIAGADGSP